MAALADSASLVGVGKQSIQPEYLSSTPNANLSPLCDWSRFPKLKWSAVIMSPNFIGFGNDIILGSSPFLLCVFLCFGLEARLASEVLREMSKVMGCRRLFNNLGRGHFRRLVGVAIKPFLREVELRLFHFLLCQERVFEPPIEMYTCTPVFANLLRIWFCGICQKLFCTLHFATFVRLPQRLRRPCLYRNGSSQRHMRLLCFGTDARPVGATRLL